MSGPKEACSRKLTAAAAFSGVPAVVTVTFSPFDVPPPGAGLVTCTVTDPAYGAKGAGTTDDTQAFVKAIMGCEGMGGGHVVVTAIVPIALTDITGSLARQCGFKGVVDLLKIAQHGPGRCGFLIDFYYQE